MSPPSADHPPLPRPDGARDAAFAEEVERLLLPHLGPIATPTGGAPPVPIETLARSLARYCAVLLDANRSLNLTGITDAPGMALRHVLDSLTVLPQIAGASTLMDLGSGGGLPGIPLALARPELQVWLVESRARKAEALAGIVDALDLSPRVRAVHARGEAWLAEHAVDIVVARAVQETAGLLKRLRPVRPAFARLVLMKGPADEAPDAATLRRWQALGFPGPESHEIDLPEGAGRRVLLCFDVDVE
ncbi:MAG: 16S rRNA (guanine(527)-N(7))-methyltransferase RsmG [Planctomycetota bacterium]|jgi:16S rRNA (guanine527-N7)-methyltransferase